MTERLENPAERLLKIIEAGRGIRQDRDCRESWRELSGVPDKNEPLLLGRPGKTIALIGEISEELLQLTAVQADRYLGWVLSFKNVFSEQNPNGQWQSLILRVDSHK